MTAIKTQFIAMIKRRKLRASPPHSDGFRATNGGYRVVNGGFRVTSK